MSPWLAEDYMSSCGWRPIPNSNAYLADIKQCPMLAFKIQTNGGQFVVAGWVYEVRHNKYVVKFPTHKAESAITSDTVSGVVINV